MKITDEQKERAAFVNLPQFLMAHGFDLKKVGREYVWKDHDSLHIKDNGPGERGAWFRFSEDKGGDNIGFLREYMGMSFVDAVEALTGEHIDRTYTPSRTYEQKPKTVTARELSLAEADNARRVFAYLCKTRVKLRLYLLRNCRVCLRTCARPEGLTMIRYRLLCVTAVSLSKKRQAMSFSNTMTIRAK